MIVKLLTEHHLEFLSLKGGWTRSPESTLVKTPHCWTFHVTAQIIVHIKSFRQCDCIVCWSHGHLLALWYAMFSCVLVTFPLWCPGSCVVLDCIDS